MKFQFNDGGRSAAGFKGTTGDCVIRAVAIAAELPYERIYNEVSFGVATQRKSKRSPKRRASARHGVSTNRKWFSDYMDALGFKWTPTMHIGSGCKVHLREGELPNGRIVVNVSRHLCAVIDGVIHDIYDPSREGNRCVYGYWTASK